MTSSFCKEPLLAPRTEPGKERGGRNGLDGLWQTSKARALAPARSSPPSRRRPGEGRLKGAAWRRLKAKQLLIYNVAEREIVAKKDKDAGIAGILQPLRLRRVKPLVCVCVEGGWFCSTPPLPGSPLHPLCESRGSAWGSSRGDACSDAEGCVHTCAAALGMGPLGCKPALVPPNLAAFGAEPGPAATLPGRGQARRRSQGMDGGQSASVFGLRAWPGDFCKAQAKLNDCPRRMGPGCSCPGKQREKELLPRLHPTGLRGHPHSGWQKNGCKLGGVSAPLAVARGCKDGSILFFFVLEGLLHLVFL